MIQESFTFLNLFTCRKILWCSSLRDGFLQDRLDEGVDDLDIALGWVFAHLKQGPRVPDTGSVGTRQLSI